MNNPPVTAVRRGETIVVADVVGRPEKIMVLSPCEHRLAYHCVTHGVPLANVGNLAMHLADVVPPHRVAAWCSQHKLFVEADAAQLAAAVPQLLQPEAVGP